MALLPRVLKHAGATDNLADALNWLDFIRHEGQDYVLLQTGNLLGLLEVQACPYNLKSDEALNASRRDYHALLQTLPPGYAVSHHVLRRRVPPLTLETDPKADPIIHTLRERQEAFWNAQRDHLFTNRTYVAVEGPTGAGRHDFRHNLLALAGLRPSFNWDAFAEGVRQFTTTFESFASGLSGIARMRRMDREAMFALFCDYLNPGDADRNEQPAYNPAYRIGDQVLGADYDNTGSDLTRPRYSTAGPAMGFRILSVETLPPTSYFGMFQRLANLGGRAEDPDLSDYWITQHFELVDAEQFIFSLNLQQNIAGGMAGFKFLRNIAQKAGDLAEDAAEVMSEIQRDKEAVGKFSMMIVLHDEDPQRLDRTTHLIRKELASLNARAVVEGRWPRVGSWLTSLPGHSGANIRRLLNYRQHKLTNTNFSDLALIQREDDGDERPVVVFGRSDGGYYRHDPFSKRTTSWNVYISGTTGAGKSFLANNMLMNSLSFRPLIYILDVGASYAPLIEAVPNSLRLDIDFESPDLALNPFHFSRPPAPTDLVTLSHLLEHLVTGGSGALNQHDRVDLMDALNQLYGAAYDPEHPPALEDYYSVLERLNRDLAKPLRLWIRSGPYAAFFSHRFDAFRSADLVYYELSNFDDHPDVASALIYMLFNKIFTQMQDPALAHRRKIIVLDESWKFLLNDVMATKIGELYRTIRKHNGSVWTITQSPYDLIHSAHKDAILTNTRFLFFLEQKGLDQEAAEAFGLNPREFQVLQGLRMRREAGFSECLLVGPSVAELQVKVDPFSMALFTTDPSEKARRADLARRHGSLGRAAEIMAGEREQTPLAREA